MSMLEALCEQVSVGRGVMRLVRDDITLLDVDAFVYYGRHDLQLGSGFGGAISVRGGPAIQEELDKLAPVETCQVVVTGAGNLKARFIIHAVGPRFNEPETESKLRTTVHRALEAAEAKGVRRIALPPMGAGFYAVPLELCARVMVEVIAAHLRGGTQIEEVTICVVDRREFEAFARQLDGLQPQEPSDR
ncbi:MAG TPA: O-acetyl-ADP-ribose deacetylase [Planctomycetaceae bacterium]|nr:O-acetyl-ADP-ribose deacetylase [Planctomycetaceae bacterium]